MQVDIPDQVVELLRDALTPVIERLIDEKVQEKRPLLLSVSQVAEELSCSRASVYGLIRGGYLEAIQVGRTYKVPSEVNRPGFPGDSLVWFLMPQRAEI